MSRRFEWRQLCAQPDRLAIKTAGIDCSHRTTRNRAMEDRGFTVTTAESVADGLTQLETTSPAFAVVDMRLEDGNGLEGMMRAAARMNEELDAAGVIDLNKREAAEAANVRACRFAGAISRMSATYQQGLLTLQRKRTGGNQHVTVKHIHQQVNVTDGGQAVVAGDKVTSRARGRRGNEERRRGMVKNER
jgi:hypothetical protein